MPRLNRRDHPSSAHAPHLDLAGGSFANERPRPLPAGAALQQVQPFAAGGHDLFLCVVVEVHRQEVVENVQGVVSHFNGPRLAGGCCRRADDEEAGAGTLPVGPLRSPPVQWPDDQLLRSVAIDIGPADTVKRGLLGDRVQLPGRIRLGSALPHPVQRSTAGRVRRLPGRPDCHIEPSVAIDVVQGQGHVVPGSGSAQHDPFLPPWRFEPHDIGAADCDDVRAAIAIHVSRGNGIPDPEIRGDLLRTEAEARLFRGCLRSGVQRGQQ